MKKLDRVALPAIALLVFLIGAVIAAGNRIPVTIRIVHPDAGLAIGPYGVVEFEFSRPVVPEAVEQLWATTPPMDGRWVWIDDRHARWRAAALLATGSTLTMQFDAGEAGQNGEWIRGEYQWTATVRNPSILAIGDVGGGREIFLLGSEEDSSALQLTHTEGRVYDYDPSSDGERVAFTALNEADGADIWTIDRDGSNARKLLDCGSDRCSSPAWSPDSNRLAFTREGAGFEAGGSKGARRSWILDLQTGQISSVFADPQHVGYGPEWSPDGLWLSIRNGAKEGIDLVNMRTGKTTLLESSSGVTGCWTPDGKYYYYSAMLFGGEGGFRNVIVQADMINKSIGVVLGGRDAGGGLSFDNPVCNPVDGRLAVTIQPDVRIPGSELFVFDPDLTTGISVMNDLSRSPYAVSWAPSGDRLVFHTVNQQGALTDIEVWVWEGGTTRKVAVGFRLPKWLP